MDLLTLFGLFSVTAMLVCYAMEKRSPWFVLGFAVTFISSPSEEAPTRRSRPGSDR